MPPKSYIAGQVPRLCCAFSIGTAPANQTATFDKGQTVTYNGALTDPSTVTLKVTDGSGSPHTYTYANNDITRENVGLYHIDLPVAMTTPGQRETWYIEWDGAGVLVAVDDSSFAVMRSNQG